MMVYHVGGKNCQNSKPNIFQVLPENFVVIIARYNWRVIVAAVFEVVNTRQRVRWSELKEALHMLRWNHGILLCR